MNSLPHHLPQWFRWVFIGAFVGVFIIRILLGRRAVARERALARMSRDEVFSLAQNAAIASGAGLDITFILFEWPGAKNDWLWKLSSAPRHSAAWWEVTVGDASGTVTVVQRRGGVR